MTEIVVRLLGEINDVYKNGQNIRVCHKYVVAVSADQIQQFFRYRKQGKKTPFLVDPSSLIQLDRDSQRGISDDGRVLQDESKVQEICQGLLGQSRETSQIFLGTLVWNVRPGDNVIIKKIIEIDPDDKAVPPRYSLRIDTDTIWLTDSAHRHFGIAEAVTLWKASPEKYPNFPSKAEFAVDLYHLSQLQEKALFRELNAKQKKITASKAQQTDTGSPLGLLKSAILSRDQVGDKLFDQNIEVNSNTNERHTLITMSVFTASVREMFGDKLIDEAKGDESLCDELAQYYCAFFGKLSKTIRVKVNNRGHDEEVTPFQNLYEKIIAPAIDDAAKIEDESIAEAKRTKARDSARELNQLIQNQEKIHSNAVVKALARIAGRIRYMSNWSIVIEAIQTRLIASRNGKYFQASNEELRTSQQGVHPIAILKDDGQINIQVQSHVIREVEKLFIEKLELASNPEFRIRADGNDSIVHSERCAFTQILRREAETYVDVLIVFSVGSLMDASDIESQCKLRIEAKLASGVAWRDANRVGKNKLSPSSIVPISGFDHPFYPGSITRYEAHFQLTLPKYTDPSNSTIDLVLDAEFPDVGGKPLKESKILSMQPVN